MFGFDFAISIYTHLFAMFWFSLLFSDGSPGLLRNNCLVLAFTPTRIALLTHRKDQLGEGTRTEPNAGTDPSCSTQPTRRAPTPSTTCIEVDEAAHLSSLSESLSLSVSELLDPLLLLRRARLGDRGDRELDLAHDRGLRDARDALVDMSLVIFCFGNRVSATKTTPVFPDLERPY